MEKKYKNTVKENKVVVFIERNEKVGS